nr:Chain P, Transcription factor p65 [Homo sapiens]3QXY_Q Chain Q, Transcription factor p65 [Homo sapiens]3RC0_P Chain P, Transcription factor p65 peptide [Homo sapiens]3RC0_Q Chain Q, Transcription factor p65 peptide [Homo sapiens]
RKRTYETFKSIMKKS